MFLCKKYLCVVMASFLRSIHAADDDNHAADGKNHMKQLIFCIAGVFITLKDCITMLSKCNYHRELFLPSRHLHVSNHQNQ